MTDFGFAKGSGVYIKVNGELLGGVISARCTSENKVERIEEFLTGVPVAQLPSKKYYIELKLNARQDSDIAKSFVPETIEFSDSQKAVTYTKCCVDSLSCEIAPRGELVYTVMISSGKRSVENV